MTEDRRSDADGTVEFDSQALCQHPDGGPIRRPANVAFRHGFARRSRLVNSSSSISTGQTLHCSAGHWASIRPFRRRSEDGWRTASRRTGSWRRRYQRERETQATALSYPRSTLSVFFISPKRGEQKRVLYKGDQHCIVFRGGSGARGGASFVCCATLGRKSQRIVRTTGKPNDGPGERRSP
jgi:hypothetical protein